MKILLLTALLTALPNGDREQGLALYRAGKYAEAQAAFQRAVAGGDASAEVQWNLALAAFKAGDLATAELAAEKYAALAPRARPELHEGMLGAVRHEEAKALVAEAEAAQQAAPPAPQPGTQPGGGGAQNAPADPLPLLERALQKEQQAKDYFVRGATAAPAPELWRNTERSLQTIAELEHRIAELKKQREQQQQQQDDGQKNDQKKDDQPKPDQPKPEEQNQDEQKQDEQQQNEQQQQSDQQQNQQQGEQQQGQQSQQGEAQQPPEPQQQPAERPEPKPEQPPPEQQPEPQPSETRSDAPGEGAEGKELTPEQAQRLLERLKDLDKKLGEARGRARTGRKPVGRDW